MVEVAAFTEVATSFTESPAVIVIVEAPDGQVRLKVVESKVSDAAAVVLITAAKAVPSIRWAPIEADAILFMLVVIW